VILNDKVVVITGASSGIGKAAAQLLANQGARVVLLARTEEPLREAAQQIKQAYIYTMDVTNVNEVNTTIEQIISDVGAIDVFINNAGFGQFETFQQTSIAQFRAMMDVNYFGVIHCTHAILPHMLERGQGHIINVASMAGKAASAKASGYAASKHAILGLTQSLRHEMRGTGITISAVNPGPVMTPFLDKADPSGGYARKLGSMLLQPEQVAEAILEIIRTRRPEKNLPLSASIGAALYQLFPRILDGIAHRLLNKK
jgi:short-subunit dehydrogenase